MKARILALAAIVIVFAYPQFTRAQGTNFTYQGQLNSNGVIANGNFDFQFGLYTNVTTGNLVTALVTNANTTVSNGLFTATLSFGNVFTGTPYWLEIGVRTNGTSSAFTILNPRQAINPAPYAIMANSASNLLGTLPASQLTGTVPASAISGGSSNAVSFTNSANVFSGNGSGLSGVPALIGTNYLFVTDTNVQIIVSPGVFQTISTSSQSANGGWDFATNGILRVQQGGLYLIQYQVHVQNDGPSYSYPSIGFGVRAMLNGITEINGSESIIVIPPAFALGILSKSFLAPIAAGQTFSLQVYANVAANQSYIAAGTLGAETYPGVTLTILRIQ